MEEVQDLGDHLRSALKQRPLKRPLKAQHRVVHSVVLVADSGDVLVDLGLPHRVLDAEHTEDVVGQNLIVATHGVDGDVLEQPLDIVVLTKPQGLQVFQAGLDLLCFLLRLRLHVADHEEDGVIVILERVAEVVQQCITGVQERDDVFIETLTFGHGVLDDGDADQFQEVDLLVRGGELDRILVSGNDGGVRHIPDRAVHQIVRVEAVENVALGGDDLILVAQRVRHGVNQLLMAQERHGVPLHGVVLDEDGLLRVNALEADARLIVLVPDYVHPLIGHPVDERIPGQCHVLLIGVVLAKDGVVHIEVGLDGFLLILGLAILQHVPLKHVALLPVQHLDRADGGRDTGVVLARLADEVTGGDVRGVPGDGGEDQSGGGVVDVVNRLLLPLIVGV